MKIEQTNIPNVIQDNIDETKVSLAESIIENVYPLFNEIHTSNIDKVKLLKQELNEKKEIVTSKKSELEGLLKEYKRKKKVSKLFNRIENIINSGLTYDGNLKHETVILLKIANKLSDDKLDYHLDQTLKTISKRFSNL